jgi:2-methylisocitrate lyase-like PEP mutase family enzyme
MNTAPNHAESFRALHKKADPLVLFNIWDAGSARAVAQAGAKVIGTGSWSVAAAHGAGDGEQLPLDDVLTNAARIVRSVSLPVTLDFEGGYASEIAALSANIERALDTGIVGINFEDQVVGGTDLYSVSIQCNRIETVRKAAHRAGVELFINARTDIFLKHYAEYGQAQLDEAITRANAYAAAGASGFFAPGLRNPAFIKVLAEGSPIPLNIMVLSDTPSNKEMSALGVSRISYGPAPYRDLMKALTEAARLALG